MTTFRRVFDAVRVRTHPLPAAAPFDAHQTRLLAVDAGRLALLLRAQRGACVLAVLTRAQAAAIHLELLAIFVRLVVHFAHLGCLG